MKTNKKLFITAICGLFALADAMAQKPMAWNTPELNQLNREERRDNFFAFENKYLAEKGDKAASARFLSMEGMWKFNFVKNYYDRPTDFFKTQFDDSQWVEFPVPGLFEINGYGELSYPNGKRVEGYFENGEFVSESNPLKNKEQEQKKSLKSLFKRK